MITLVAEESKAVNKDYKVGDTDYNVVDIESYYTLDQKRALSELRAATTLSARATLAGGVGYSFGSNRNLDGALGYKTELSPQDYRMAYERGGIAERIVEAYPNATWRGNTAIKEKDDRNKQTAWEVKWATFAKRVKMWQIFRHADILAGLGRYAVVLIGAPGSLDTEISGTSLDNILFLKPYGEDNVTIEKFQKNEKDPRFGLPLVYKFKKLSNDTTSSGDSEIAVAGGRLVHWSRVIHIAENTLDSRIYGRPRLRPVWNHLDDLKKVVGGGAEAFWQRSNPGMQMDLDKDAELDAAAETALGDEVDEYLHGTRRIIRTRGVTMRPLAMTVASMGPGVESILELIAATTAIPKRILSGSERGELASSHDRTNWNERIQERREDHAADNIIQEFVDRVTKAGFIAKKKSQFVMWPAVESLTEMERIESAETLSRSNQRGAQVIFLRDEVRAVAGYPPILDVANQQEIDKENEFFEKDPKMPGDDATTRDKEEEDDDLQG